jgi:hypothetical protein
MTNLEYVKTKLLENKDLYKEICFKTQISEQTLRNIVGGKNPSHLTLTALSNFFKRRESKSAKAQGF